MPALPQRLLYLVSVLFGIGLGIGRSGIVASLHLSRDFLKILSICGAQEHEIV